MMRSRPTAAAAFRKISALPKPMPTSARCGSRTGRTKSTPARSRASSSRATPTCRAIRALPRAIWPFHADLLLPSRMREGSTTRELPMKAAILEKAGTPLVIDQLSVSKPGPHEVLIRTVACGLCHSDLHFIEGTYPHPIYLLYLRLGVVLRLQN